MVDDSAEEESDAVSVDDDSLSKKGKPFNLRVPGTPALQSVVEVPNNPYGDRYLPIYEVLSKEAQQRTDKYVHDHETISHIQR